MASHAGAVKWQGTPLSIYRKILICMDAQEHQRAHEGFQILLGAQERLVAYQGKLVTVQDVSGEVANGTGTPHAGNSNPYTPTAKSPGRPAERRSILCAVRLLNHAPGPAPHKGFFCCAPVQPCARPCAPIRVSRSTLSLWRGISTGASTGSGPRMVLPTSGCHSLGCRICCRVCNNHGPHTGLGQRQFDTWRVVSVSGNAGRRPHATYPFHCFCYARLAVGFAITTAPAPDLDSTNLVVGRVVSGASLVDDLAALPAVKANSSSPFFWRVLPYAQRACVAREKPHGLEQNYPQT